MKDGITIESDFSPALYEHGTPPLVTLYIPVDTSAASEELRKHTEALVAEVLTKLERGFEKREYPTIAQDLDYVAAHINDVINADTLGIAVLSSEDGTRLFQLPYPAGPVAYVGERYYLKPLLRSFTFGDHYVLLAIASNRFAVIRGNCCELERVELPCGMAATFDELYPDDDGANPISVRSSGKPLPWYYGADQHTEDQIDSQKFFRYVNDMVVEHVLKDGVLPVILVGLPENQSEFRKVARIPHLLEQGINHPAEALSEARLLSEANALAATERARRIGEVIERYGNAKAQGAATDTLEELGLALVERKVDTLFVDEEAHVAGAFDPTTGQITLAPNDSSHTTDACDVCGTDLLDMLAQATFQQGGTVYLLSPDDMPEPTAAAALFRY